MFELRLSPQGYSLPHVQQNSLPQRQFMWVQPASTGRHQAELP